MTPRRSVLLVGGPDAGKSNFLARLWIAINSNMGLLCKDGLAKDLRYLEDLAGELLLGKFVPHTPTLERNQSTIPFRSSKQPDQVGGELVVPDWSGEHWMEVYSKREWSSDWDELISRTCGCLVFVRVDSPQVTPALDPVVSARYCLGNTTPEESSGHVTPTIPTQVLLTEWLQFLRIAFTDRVGGWFRPRIGVVVSAWDLVPYDEQDTPPYEYLGTNYPMFKQFLNTNAGYFEFACFGVSVVGGELNPQRDPDFLPVYKSGDPRTSGYVVHTLNGDVEQSRDLTLPVAWAIGAC